MTDLTIDPLLALCYTGMALSVLIIIRAEIVSKCRVRLLTSIKDQWKLKTMPNESMHLALCAFDAGPSFVRDMLDLRKWRYADFLKDLTPPPVTKEFSHDHE